METFLADINWASALRWLGGHAVLIVLLLVLCLVLQSAVKRAIPGIMKAALTRNREASDADELAKRYTTLGDVTVRTAEVVIWVTFIVTVLSLLGIPIAALLAGVSVVGIAVGFGAQTLVKDFLSGVFILFENQYGKGDVVSIAGVSGLVEDVNLRRTVLRDQNGTVHNVPNGEIRVASNLTRDWSRVNLNVSISYGQDLDDAIQVIDRVGEELSTDPDFGPLIVEAPKGLRVDAFEDSGIAIKILGVTKPGKQWEVMGELRKRLKKTFDEEGVEISVAQPKVLFVKQMEEQQREKEASRPVAKT